MKFVILFTQKFQRATASSPFILIYNTNNLKPRAKDEMHFSVDFCRVNKVEWKPELTQSLRSTSLDH